MLTLKVPEILERYRIIAVVGLSRDSAKYSNMVSRFMQNEGYKIIPINPVADRILGEKVHRSLAEVRDRIEIVDVFRPSDEALGITVQAVAAGAKVVWLQEGIISKDAQVYAMERGLEFVQDKCIMEEYIRWREGDHHGS